MSNSEIGEIALTLSVLLVFVHVLGFLFERLRQPRLVGEILAGAILGPFVLGRFFPEISSSLFAGAGTGVGAPSKKIEVVLGFIYWIGLLFLMFLSGSETRRLMAKENQRETAWLFGVGTTVPFLIVISLGSFLPLERLMGEANRPLSTLLVLAVAVAVTSIPVISRIFMDLRIIHTRFASLILSFAVLEDIVLWGVLAVATGVARQTHVIQDISTHLAITFAYMVVGILIAPALLKKLHSLRLNVLVRASPAGYLFFLLFVYSAIAAALDVNLVFAAFLAGFGLVGGMKGEQRERFAPQLEAVSRVSSGFFIPIYFALVGYRLALGRDFSFPILAVFLIASSVIAFSSFVLAARLAGFRGLDVLNLAITKNARGGPGIVLASVAYDAGIINASFYTALVLTAILTSQAAGAWLRFVLAKGWPLLASSSAETAGWKSGQGVIGGKSG